MNHRCNTTVRHIDKLSAYKKAENKNTCGRWIKMVEVTVYWLYDFRIQRYLAQNCIVPLGMLYLEIARRESNTFIYKKL